MQQLAEEGVVQLFIPFDGSGAIVGVVGALQLDVLKERLGGPSIICRSITSPCGFSICRWVEADDRAELDKFMTANNSAMANDLDGCPGLHGAVAVLAAIRCRALAGPSAFTDVKDYQRKAE